MTNKERATAYREAAEFLQKNELRGMDVTMLLEKADELDPPPPGIGTPVLWTYPSYPPAPMGHGVSGGAAGLWTANGLKPWADVNWKRSRRISLDEVAISRESAQAILGEHSYHNIGIGTVFATDARTELRNNFFDRVGAEYMEDER